jgi:hypothetical protein
VLELVPSTVEVFVVCDWKAESKLVVKSHGCELSVVSLMCPCFGSLPDQVLDAGLETFVSLRPDAFG